MPDISMCQNMDCPIRAKCYRYVAYPSQYWQAYHPYLPEIYPNRVVCQDQMSTEGWPVRDVREADVDNFQWDKRHTSSAVAAKTGQGKVDDA